ncbi:thymidine kinase, cytosolic-like isoform X2 [Synchiropus splendidus]|uniref:thymidine kinase, cytosolic-like isoform X2 n=1 Tax=Synchiropus splendidus TaxID=270530 RepID=UPI00237D6CB9|nr:thymidine kinase, cytosolic-like isoform X2 [Synchiropus splendidus]
MDCVDFPRIFPNSPRKSRGQIQVIFGPMFSGKSTELMRRVRRFQIAQYYCLVIKYAKDTRYSDHGMATHDKSTMEAVPACCLAEFPDTVEFCEEMANLGKTVIVAALDGTFQRKPFGNILNLVPLAESVVKLHAVCMQCYKEAAYTKRIGAEKEVEVIGGADKYQAVCRRCYGGLTVNKENRSPFKNETPSQNLVKIVDSGIPRKLFSSLQL